MCLTDPLKFRWLKGCRLFYHNHLLGRINRSHGCHISGVVYLRCLYHHIRSVVPYIHYDDVIMNAIASQITSLAIVITRVSEVIMFSPCVFVCLSRCLSGRFNYEGLVPHKQYFPGTLLGMSSCASYVSRTHDVIDDVTRLQSRSNFESDISPSIFELERWSKAQNVGNAHGYLSGLFNFRYNFR